MPKAGTETPYSYTEEFGVANVLHVYDVYRITSWGLDFPAVSPGPGCKSTTLFWFGF